MQASTRGRPRAVEFPGRAPELLPPPGSKAAPSTQRRGRTERHELSSPVATISAPADRRAKSDGVPRWGCLSRARPVTPIRCVQQLSPAVECLALPAIAGPSRGRTVLPPPDDEGIAFVIGGGEEAARRSSGTSRAPGIEARRARHPRRTADARAAIRAPRGADGAAAVLLRLDHPGLRVLRRLRAQRAGRRHAVDLRRADDERASAGRARRCRARCRSAASWRRWLRR